MYLMTDGQMIGHYNKGVIIMDNKRRICFLVNDKTLEPEKEIKFDNVKKGDIFVLYEDDETVVVDDKNKLVGLITKSTLVTTLSKKYDESEDD